MHGNVFNQSVYKQLAIASLTILWACTHAWCVASALLTSYLRLFYNNFLQGTKIGKGASFGCQNWSGDWFCQQTDFCYRPHNITSNEKLTFQLKWSNKWLQNIITWGNIISEYFNNWLKPTALNNNSLVNIN